MEIVFGKVAKLKLKG